MSNSTIEKMCVISGKTGYTEQGNVETVNNHGYKGALSRAYHFAISLHRIELSCFSTNSRPYYYYY